MKNDYFGFSSTLHYYLAAVLLKQLVKQHWHEDDDNFVYPVLPLLEKVFKYQCLLMSSNMPCWLLLGRDEPILLLIPLCC